MRLPLFLAICAALATACTPPAFAAEAAHVTLLHTTDLHGSLTAWDYARDRPAARGLVKLATLVRAARAEGSPTLLVDAGDATEGGIETAFRLGPQRRPDPMIAAMNALGYDAMTVGNHQFDFGWHSLESARAASRFPWLGANVVGNDRGRAAFVPSIVKQAGPVRIGLIGICTPAVPRFMDATNVAGLRFEDPVATARREAARLRDVEHCDAVVLVAHTGLERDPETGVERRGDTPDENWGYRLASEVKGIDVLVLGHTHAVVASADVGGVLVTQAGKWGEALGRVDLAFERDGASAGWRLASRRARVLALTDSVATDPALAALAAPYHREAQALLAMKVGTATCDLAAPRGRLANGATWELIHRAQLAATGAEVSLAALPDPTVRIARGAVTRRDLLRLYPYGNTLGVVEMTGADLRATLEQSARFFATYTFEAGAPLVDPAMPAYNFDSAYGVDYTIDLTRPAGDRITSLTFKGMPVAGTQRFKVAVGSYRMYGGGGFESVRRARRLSAGTIEVRDAIANLLRKSGPADGTWVSNWTLLPDYAACPERPLVDLLVRMSALAPGAVKQLRPDEAPSRHEVEQWIDRAFGFSVGAVPPPEPLQYAMASAGGGLTRPDGVTRDAVADACLSAAFKAGYQGLDPDAGATSAAAFRRALVSGTSLAPATGPAEGPGSPAQGGASAGTIRAPHARPADAALAADPPVTRVQALGMIANARYPVIRVLDTTDFHGAILPGQRERRSGRMLGGSPALAAAIERLRAENPEGTVLIDGGDLFQGTMISNLQFGRPVVEQMNALGYAATAIGNHEFDWSVDTLARRVQEMKFAALGANLRERGTGRMPDWARSDTTVVRRGLKVSVLGLCYRFTPTVTLAKHVAALEFLDDSTVAAGLAPRLRPACDVLIGVGHIPAESDSTRRLRGGDLRRLAGVRGVDAWFGGHSHNLVLDSMNGIPFAIAGSHGTTVAVCDLVVDPEKHQVVERHCDLRTVYVDEGIDSLMQARVERWNAGVAPIANQRLGTNLRPLTLNRGGESTVGDFVCDAIREASGADIAMQNSGGLRADLPGGPVTRGSIYEVMPFDNTVFMLELTGAEVKLALEQALRTGRVTQVSGIRYAFDPESPPLKRIRLLATPDGKPLDDNKLYRVAVNDFMATGGDEYAVLRDGQSRRALDLLVRDALERQVMKLAQGGKSLDYQPTGRIERLGAAVPAGRGD